MKAKIFWDDMDNLFRGKYLIIEEDVILRCYTISNDKLEDLGRIELVKLGTWSHWCLFLNEDCYLSPGCNDEVREVQRILGSQSHKEKFAKGGISE